MDSDTRKSKAKKLIELCLGKFMQFMQIQGEHFSSGGGGAQYEIGKLFVRNV